MNKLFKLNIPNTELIWTPDYNIFDASSKGGLGVGAPPSGITNIDWSGYWKDYRFHTSDAGFSPPNHSGDGGYTVLTFTETNTDSSGRHYKTTVTVTIEGTINSDGSYSGMNSITISSYSEYV